MDSQKYTVLYIKKSHYFCSLPAECSVYKTDNTPNNGISLYRFVNIQLRHCETPPSNTLKMIDVPRGFVIGCVCVTERQLISQTQSPVR